MNHMQLPARDFHIHSRVSRPELLPVAANTVSVLVSNASVHGSTLAAAHIDAAMRVRLHLLGFFKYTSYLQEGSARKTREMMGDWNGVQEAGCSGACYSFFIAALPRIS